MLMTAVFPHSLISHVEGSSAVLLGAGGTLCRGTSAWASVVTTTSVTSGYSMLALAGSTVTI